MKTAPILAIKEKMSQVFDENGCVAVVTFANFKDKKGLDGGDVEKTFEGLKVGDKIDVTGVSKGRGFQGVVKRHGFKGGPRSHGQKHSEREAGSIGGGGRAGGRVVKGMRMPGRMGGDKVTVKNLRVIDMNKEKGTILISGAVPGRRGTVLAIRK